MQIFDKHIFGTDADWFMTLSCAKKKEWIKANTNQHHDSLIEDFVKSLVRGKDDECDGCKKAKAQIDAVSKEQDATASIDKPAKKK